MTIDLKPRQKIVFYISILVIFIEVHLFSFLWHLTRTDGKALPAKLVNLKYLKDIYSPHKVSSVEQTLTFLSFFVHRQRALILEHYYIRYSPTCALLCIEVYLQCTLKAMCIFSMHRYFCRKIIMIFFFFTVKEGKLLLHFAKNGLSTASTPSNLQRRTDSESDFHHRSLIFTLNF